MEIRELNPEDVDAWLHLRELLGPDHGREDLKREQRVILTDRRRNRVFVAARPDGELIGFAEVSLRAWAEGCTTQPVGYIEGWYVQPEHRRSHVGRRLIEIVERWAASRGCTEMGSDTEIWNQDSQLSHRARGYSEAARLICFAKKLNVPEAND